MVQDTGQLLTTDNHSVRFDSYMTLSLINKKEIVLKILPKSNLSFSTLTSPHIYIITFTQIPLFQVASGEIEHLSL